MTDPKRTDPKRTDPKRTDPTPDPTPGRQKQKSEHARAVICEAAIACLFRLGYSETTIDRVVEEAGVSRGALQHHFPSKEDLMTSTAHYLLQRPLRHAARVRATLRRDVRQDLRDLWKRMTDTQAYRALLEILMAARTDSVLRQRIAGDLENSIREIDEQFARRYGDLGPAQQTELRRLMCANRCFMRGLLIEAQYGTTKTEQRAVLETWLDLIAPSLDHLYEAN